MGRTKKIQIKAEFLTQDGRRRKKKQKPKINNLIKPNKVKRALMKRIAEHHKQQKQQEQGEKEQAVFKTDFKETLSYLNSVVKNKTLKQEKKRKRRERKRKEKQKKQVETSITTHIRQQDDPPYGILKGGKKQLYSEYKKTLRHKERHPTFSPIIFPESKPIDNINKKQATAILERKKKLQNLREKIQTPQTIRKKRYTLGKRGRKVGIMIQGKKTRRKIKREHNALKTKDFHEIKLYLKKHGLIKVGSTAPESILRAIYETSILSGDIYNKNNNVFLHNYINTETS